MFYLKYKVIFGAVQYRQIKQQFKNQDFLNNCRQVSEAFSVPSFIGLKIDGILPIYMYGKRIRGIGLLANRVSGNYKEQPVGNCIGKERVIKKNVTRN